jgi:hypothetical protein
MNPSRSYDHDPNHYRFQRTLSGDLEPSGAVYGWGHDLLAMAGIAMLVAVLWAAAWVLSGLFV